MTILPRHQHADKETVLHRRKLARARKAAAKQPRPLREAYALTARTECPTETHYKPDSFHAKVHIGYVAFFFPRLGRNPPPVDLVELEDPAGFAEWANNQQTQEDEVRRTRRTTEEDES